MTTPRTILIADDHPIFRKGLREVIESDPGLRIVEETSDGETALQRILALRPDVAILDIHMPRRSGLDVARALWKEQIAVPLVMLTMYDDEELFHEAMDLGVLGYILKESASEDLLSAIRGALEGQPFISALISRHLVNRQRQTRQFAKTKPGLDLLTPSERQILKLVAQDLTSKEIAEKLQISVRTVDTHRQNICHKLDLSGSHSLLKFAYDHKAEL